MSIFLRSSMCFRGPHLCSKIPKINIQGLELGRTQCKGMVAGNPWFTWCNPGVGITTRPVYIVCASRGGYWTKFWRGCAAAERQNPPMSKGDERTRQAPCLRKLSPWRPICMDPPPNILSSAMPSQPLQQSPGGNRITPQIHPVSITPIKHLWLPKSLEIRYLDPSCRDDDKI